MNNRDVIVACDFASAEETLRFLERFGTERPFLKIGMELYYAEGPQIVRTLKDRGHGVFLDLKLHDIPNTVKKAMRVLSGLGADIVNLHAAGTRAMMEAALEGLQRPDGTRPKLIAVTQLTSTDQAAMEQELLIREPIASRLTRSCCTMPAMRKPPGWTAWSALRWRRARCTHPAGTASSP